VPNLSLWTSTAGLVKVNNIWRKKVFVNIYSFIYLFLTKDGFVFLKNKATSGKNNYSNIWIFSNKFY
jgi:hypothetical protein